MVIWRQSTAARIGGIAAAFGAAAVMFQTCAVRAAPAFDAGDRARLAAGGAVVHVGEDLSGEADAQIAAAIDIAAPPSRVYAVMTDCPRAPTFVAGLKSCRVLERSPGGLTDIREHRSQWMALFPETVSVFRSTYALNSHIRFERVRGDLKFLKGIWTLQPRNSGAATRLTYEVRVSASIKAPAFMVRSALEQDVPKLLDALRREAVSGK